MTSSNYDVINRKIAISLKVCNLSLPNLNQRCISLIANFFKKKIQKKMMTSAKINKSTKFKNCPNSPEWCALVTSYTC